jgi:AcrR family transcriptional regulator
MSSARRKIKPRRYESVLRTENAERTRANILAAARELFITRGYGAMTMKAIAEEAGVALDTVYEAVGKKPLVVRLLVETAISNTDRDVPAEEREYVKQIRASTSAHEMLAIYAAAMRDIHGRLAPLVRAVEVASRAHPELAEVWKEIAERRARNLRQLAQGLLRTGEVREGLSVERIADVLWATNSPELYTLLVEQRSWSPDDYASWLADTWVRLFLA